MMETQALDANLWLHTLSGLCLVVACIFLLSWVVRRIQKFKESATAPLQLLGSLSLGPRERVLWIQAGDTQLLIGVAPGRVQTLHVFRRCAQDVSADDSAHHTQANTANEPSSSPLNFATLMKRLQERNP